MVDVCNKGFYRQKAGGQRVRGIIRTTSLYSGHSERTFARLRVLSECVLFKLNVLIMPHALAARPLSVCEGLKRIVYRS